MALIQLPTETNASAEVRPIFDVLKGIVSFVPAPTLLLGASPPLLKHWWSFTQHYLEHPRFSREFLVYLRLLVSVHGEFPYCLEFNTRGLKKITGMGDDEVAAIRQDPSQARLPDNERALLLFVLDAVRAPEEATAGDVAQLRDAGWTDQEIFEAVYYGGWMLHLGLLFNVFKMDHA